LGIKQQHRTKPVLVRTQVNKGPIEEKMSVSLNPLCKSVIASLNLTPYNQKIIETCVSRYSTPYSFSETLSYIVHRIKNTVISIFKLSDWQVAERVIGDYLSTKINFNRKIQQIFVSYPQVLDKKVYHLLQSTIDTVILCKAKILLKGIVQVNNSTTRKQAICNIDRTKKRLDKRKVLWEKTFDAKLEHLVKQLPPSYSTLKGIKLTTFFS
jgi:deoxyadenosine/deoxycytidine kinase